MFKQNDRVIVSENNALIEGTVTMEWNGEIVVRWDNGIDVAYTKKQIEIMRIRKMVQVESFPNIFHSQNPPPLPLLENERCTKHIDVAAKWERTIYRPQVG